MTTDTLALQRLLSWTSPSFPIGAFSYSGGLEAAIEEGLVADRDSLGGWCRFHLQAGAARQDAWALVATLSGDQSPDRVNQIILALRQTRETRQEVALLGDAFAKVMVGVWGLALPAGMEGDKAYPVLFALAARDFGIDTEAALAAFLHAWLANQVSVACRVIPLGQTDGQRIMAAFEPDIAALAAEMTAVSADHSQPPLSAALVADLCSVKHETQYSRLFRS